MQQHVGHEQPEPDGDRGEQRRSPRAARRAKTAAGCRPRSRRANRSARTARRGSSTGTSSRAARCALPFPTPAFAFLPDRLGTATRVDRLPAGALPMTLLLLVIARASSPAAAASLARRRRGAGPVTARRAAEAARRARAAPARRRLDPEVATGLALTLALVLIVAGGLVLAVLAHLVRGDADLVRLDRAWRCGATGTRPPFSTDVLDAVTDLGEPMVVAVLAAALAIAETVRTRSRWVVPFLLLVVAGQRLAHHDGQAPRRSRAPGRQPGGRDARTVVPERPLVLVDRVLRRGRAPARPRARPRGRALLVAGGAAGARRDGRRQPRAARACTG